MAQLVKLFVDTPRFFLYGAAPIVLDYGIFNLASSKMWKYGGSTAIGLGAVAVLSRYSPHTRVIALIYFAYKVLQFWSNISWGASKRSPSLPERWEIEDARLAALRHRLEIKIDLYKKFEALEKHLKIAYIQPWKNWKDLNTFAKDPQTLLIVREGWSKHWKEALELTLDAAREFETLRQELWKKFDSAPSEEVRLQQIAEFLQKDNSLQTHSTSYSGISQRGFPENLLGFYRFIRSMSYEIAYMNSKSQPCTAIYEFPMHSDENSLFYIAEQGQIREIYNQAIDRWLPIMEYLPSDSPYHEWFQKDEPNIHFNFNPPPLPS